MPIENSETLTVVPARNFIEPVMAASGNTDAATAGASFATFAAQVCKQLTIVNNTGTDIEVQQDGTGDALPVTNGTSYPFYGLKDASQLAVRRIDRGATSVTVKARWEA